MERKKERGVSKFLEGPTRVLFVYICKKKKILALRSRASFHSFSFVASKASNSYMDRYSPTVEGSLRYFLAKQGRSKKRVCLEILARLAFFAPARYGCANTSCSRTFNQRANTCYCHCYRHIDVLSSSDDK